jgi:murein DD-endopeptidase MepM/ murein hydrolase activator NlpD
MLLVPCGMEVMSVTTAGQSPVFGRRKEPHTIIIARGDQIRHFTVRPWLAALAGSAFFAMAIGYLLATTYLVMRDDLIGAGLARQARMQQAYEDRISALRAQVDRITSRQLLDQQLMEDKVSELLERQTQLSARHGRLGEVLDRAATELPDNTPRPTDKPDVKAELEAYAPLRTADAASAAFSLWDTRNDSTADESAADHADKLFVAINQSLRSIEQEQMQRVTTLAENAYQTADQIATALEAAGLEVDGDYGKQDVGGPLIPIDSSAIFDAKVKELDEALDQLEALKKEARRYPIANPAPGQPITSGFGVRKDPLLGTLALHSGIDFRYAIGSPARATAPGVVTAAGWNGGYGRMVEIDHGNGFATRYGHLSRIDVKVGDHVKLGSVVGETGSSGRSTGPHLHYEVRHNGDAIDPLGFLKLGMKVSKLL